VQQASGEGVQGLVKFNREKVPEKGEVCGEGSRTLWRRARSGSTGIRRRFRRRFPEKVWELWCRARSGSTRFGKRFRRRFQESRKHWWKAKSSSMVSGEGCGEGREALVQSQSQVRFNRVSEKVPALGFEARFRKICKNKTLRLLGIPPELIFCWVDLQPGGCFQGFHYI
jgi:hypothetical protein